MQYENLLLAGWSPCKLIVHTAIGKRANNWTKIPVTGQPKMTSKIPPRNVTMPRQRSQRVKNLARERGGRIRSALEPGATAVAPRG